MKSIMLIYVSTTGNGKTGNNGNNNKFYYVELLDNGDIIKKYGRIGAEGTTRIQKKGGTQEYYKIINQKKKKGYKEAEIDTNINKKEIKNNLLDVAMEQIKTKDTKSKELIKELVKENIHNITTNTKITYDIKTGFFSTPLGIVTEKGVIKAKAILDKIEKLFKKDEYRKEKRKEFIKLNEEYFTIIPTKIKNLRDFENLLINNKKLSEQYGICEALLSSIEIIEKEKNKKSKEKGKIEQIFDLTIEYLNDDKEVRRIKNYFEKSKNRKHGQITNQAKIKKIFKIKIEKEEKEYKKEYQNQMELWHGTKIANIMSILKEGLLMPKYSPGSVTGYMFGQGLYFAKQSSKSMNYCDGMYWNNSKRRNKIYLFLADIAMGNYKIPLRSTSKNPPKGYDSYWAQPQKSGVLNDEMIVFKNNQIKLKYLIEIEI